MFQVRHYQNVIQHVSGVEEKWDEEHDLPAGIARTAQDAYKWKNLPSYIINLKLCKFNQQIYGRSAL
jgi:hypothetical protein